MAVKIIGTTVIDDSRRIIPNELNGLYTNFHPSQNTITADIDFTTPLMKLAMTGNVTFTTSNRASGHQATLVLDTSTSAHTPTFPSEVVFGVTPTWSSNRHWIISLTCWDSSTVRATALPYDEPGATSSTFNNFSLTGWDTVNTHFASSGFPESWCELTFSRDDSNNRVIIQRAHGDSGAPGTYVDVYATYTGLTGITSVEAQYNVSSQSCTGDCTPSNYTFGPTPASDGYNSGTYYTVPADPGGLRFGWSAQANPNAGEEATTTADVTSGNPDFRIKIVCNEGTFYSTAEAPGTLIYQRAYIGSQASK